MTDCASFVAYRGDRIHQHTGARRCSYRLDRSHDTFSDGASRACGHKPTASHIGRKRSDVDGHQNHHSHHIVDVSRLVDKGNASEIEIGAEMATSQHPMQVIWERTMDSVFVSDPDSTISPSDGVDSDLDRREAICHTNTAQAKEEK